MSGTNGSPPPGRGPIDVGLWPDTLTARVVDGGPAPRIHGYDVQADLARHYSFAELMLLSLTGEPPSPGAGRAFEIALAFLSPVSVAEAPVHAAGLARLIGADGTGVLASAAIGLAERARYLVAEHAVLLEWLDAPEGEHPALLDAGSDEDREAVARLRAALAETNLESSASTRRPTLTAALLSVLHAVGLKTAAQLEAAITFAALPAAVAEALSVKPFAFFSYPMNLPAFRYVEEARDD
jgi:hypothetical protein